MLGGLGSLREQLRELLVVPTFPRHSSETTEWRQWRQWRQWRAESGTQSLQHAAEQRQPRHRSVMLPVQWRLSSTPSIAAPCFGSFTRESGLDICNAIFAHFLSLCIPKTFKPSSVADDDCDLSSRY